MAFHLDAAAAMQLDDVYECAQLLRRYCYQGTDASCGPIPQALAYFSQKYNISACRQQQLAPMAAVYEHVIGGLTLTKQQLCRWFAPLPGAGDLCAAELIRNAVENGEWSRSCLLAMLRGDLLDGGSAQKLDQTAFLRELAALDIPDESKWQLTDISLQLEAYDAQIQAILKQAAALFAEKKQLLAPLLEEFGRPLLQMLSAAGLPALLQETGLHYSGEEQVQFAFSVMGFNGLAAAYLDRPGQEDCLVLHYGLLIHWVQEIKQQSINQDTVLLARLRAIADKNRLQMLLALREKSLRGQDLAAMFSLSPATISHHVGELMRGDLLEIEKQGSSYYYRLSVQGVENLLQQLRSRLC